LRPGFQIERAVRDYTRNWRDVQFGRRRLANDVLFAHAIADHRSRRSVASSRDRSGGPKDLDIHSSWTKTTPRQTQTIRNWLASVRRWRLHLTPTSASWITPGRALFDNLTEKENKYGAGVHRSTASEAAIKDFTSKNVNADSKPFKWHKVGADIIASIQALLASQLKTTDNQHTKDVSNSESGHSSPADD